LPDPVFQYPTHSSEAVECRFWNHPRKSCESRKNLIFTYGQPYAVVRIHSA